MPARMLPYEPSLPGRRRVHPALAVVIAHVLASYSVGLGVLAVMIWRAKTEGLPLEMAAWTRWAASAPAQVPGSFIGHLLDVARGRSPPNLEIVAWALVFLAQFAVIFTLLCRRRRSRTKLPGRTPT